MDHKDIVDVLTNTGEPVSFSFYKKDGTVRKMIGTRNPKLVPTFEKKTDKTKIFPPNVIAVYDMENKGWRSFLDENFIAFE